jgi:hypothetical protein
MKQHLLLSIFCFAFIAASAQEVDLNSFVAEKQNSLVYDSTKMVQVPNTHVFMIPPEHFIVDSEINGFSHPGSGTTIQVLELPKVNHRIIEQGMTTEHITSQGYEFIEKQEITTEKGKRAVIFFVRFSTNDVEYERAMLFTGEKNTIWVNINYPVSMKKLLFPAIESALKSVQ